MVSGKIPEAPRTRFQMAEGSSDRIRVLIADDHRMFRDLLRSALAAECEIVAEAEDGETTLATAIRTKPQVILLDVLMPGIGGLAAAHELARKIPGIRILVLSQYCDPESGRCMRACVT
jgi:DNA-binding NarL/FixJ family response regulator